MVKKLKNKSNVFKAVIVVLLVFLIIVMSGVGYVLIKGDGAEAISGMFESEEEYTILLDEFLINLKSNGNKYNYLKISVAPMFTSEKDKNMIEENQNKIRDIITHQLRNCTAEEMLDVEHTENLKKEIKDSINAELGEEIVKDIYFTDMVVQ